MCIRDRIHPSIQSDFKCGNSIAIEIYISRLDQLIHNNDKYNSISKFPSTTRDVTYIMNKSVLVGDVLAILNDKKPNICKLIRCCGYYQPDLSDDVSAVSYTHLTLPTKA